MRVFFRIFHAKLVVYVGLSLCLMLSTRPVQSGSGDLQLTYGVEENQLILSSLDATVLNFGDEADKDLYKLCVRHYVLFQQYHTRGDIGKATETVRNLQRMMVPLYEKLLQKNIEIIRGELDRLGKKARRNEKLQTVAFFQLGYRNLKESEQKLIFAQNTRPYMHLLKLRDMLFSLKILKQAGKFTVLLSLLHDTDLYSEIEETDYMSIDNKIELNRWEQKKLIATLHRDNHFYPPDGESLFRTTMDNPKIEELLWKSLEKPKL